MSAIAAAMLQVPAFVLLTPRNFQGRTSALIDVGIVEKGASMISVIIILLALVLASLIGGVFLMTFMELRQIDDAAAPPELAAAGASASD